MRVINSRSIWEPLTRHLAYGIWVPITVARPRLIFTAFRLTEVSVSEFRLCPINQAQLNHNRNHDKKYI